MEQKIQELTQKIYQEGVAKGEEKAQQITKEARDSAARIVSDAQAQAEKVIADAQKQASELKRNAESELKLTGAQAISSIKQQITDVILADTLDAAATKTLSDPETLKSFLEMVLKNWNGGSGEMPDLSVVLPQDKQNDLTNALKKSSMEILKSGKKVQFSKNLKAGFKIGPADGKFKVSFTDEDFREFFKEYLRPKTRSYLFGE